MKPNNNFSVLPFYTDINLQNHRLSYAYGAINPLVTPTNRIPPFQIIVDEPKRPAPYRIAIYDKNGNEVKNIIKEMVETGFSFVKNVIDGKEILTYPSYLPLQTDLKEGLYYLVVGYNSISYYSDLFCMKNDMSEMLKIEWYDLENFMMDNAAIVYRNPSFMNRMYFNAEIGKPSYPFEEDVEKRDGYVFPIKQISEKTYKFVILATEYMLDVMRFIRMADFVRITDKYGRIYDCDTFLMTPNWQKNGDLASVEIEFATDTIAKKIGGGYIKETKGDFNEDYGNDFFNN